MRNRFKIVLVLVLLVSSSWGGFIDAIKNYDNNEATIPHVLSEIGMYSDFSNKVIAEDLIEYTVNTPYWVDGTHKERWIWLPPGTSIVPNDSIGWDYPEGAVIVKNFTLDTIAGDPSSEIIIETRLLVKRAARWRYLTYEWRLDQTEANLVNKRDGNNVFFRRWVNGNQVHFRWRFTSVAECSRCHNQSIGPVGMVGPNMNMPSPYDASKNQLQELNERGVFSVNLLAANPNLHKWVDKDDPSASLEVKARSWFAMNCGTCHADDAGAGGAHSFTYWQAEKEPNYLELESFAYPAFPKPLYPGRPDSSYFLKRMTERATFSSYNGDQMPPLITYKIDSVGVQIVSDWICELGGQPAGCNPITFEEPPIPEIEEFMSTDTNFIVPEVKELPIFPHTIPKAGDALYAFARNQTLYVSGLEGKSVDVQLVDLKGKSVDILRLDNNRFYVRGELTTGVYVLKAGSRVFKFNYIQ